MGLLALREVLFDLSKNHWKIFLFLVRTMFYTQQDFCKHNETSKIPTTSFGGCKPLELFKSKNVMKL